MIFIKDPKRLDDEDKRDIVKGVIIAAGAALVTELVSWGVEIVRDTLDPSRSRDKHESDKMPDAKPEDKKPDDKKASTP